MPFQIIRSSVECFAGFRKESLPAAAVQGLQRRQFVALVRTFRRHLEDLCDLLRNLRIEALLTISPHILA